MLLNFFRFRLSPNPGRFTVRIERADDDDDDDASLGDTACANRKSDPLSTVRLVRLGAFAKLTQPLPACLRHLTHAIGGHRLVFSLSISYMTNNLVLLYPIYIHFLAHVTLTSRTIGALPLLCSMIRRRRKPKIARDTGIFFTAEAFVRFDFF